MNNLEHLTEEDILYDPQSDTYKIRFGKFGEETLEISGSSLHSENVGAILRGTDDDFFRKTYIGDWAEAAMARTAAEAEEAARAGVIPSNTIDVPWEVHTHGTDIFLADAQGHRYSIIGDNIMVPVKDQGADADVDSKADHQDSAANGTGTAAADRYPSIPCRALIEDAIELLNKNKKLRLSKISLNRFGPDYILTVSSRGHTALGKTPVRRVEMSIDPTVFDRMLKIEQDRDAGLGDSLDTNTYIKLRIAFLLYRALSLTDEEARKFCVVGVFRVMFSNTQFDYSV
jgi:hypothetical protein